MVVACVYQMLPSMTLFFQNYIQEDLLDILEEIKMAAALLEDILY